MKEINLVLYSLIIYFHVDSSKETLHYADIEVACIVRLSDQMSRDILFCLPVLSVQSDCITVIKLYLPVTFCLCKV